MIVNEISNSLALGLSCLLLAGPSSAVQVGSSCNRDCLIERAERFLPENIRKVYPGLQTRIPRIHWNNDSSSFWYVATENGALALYTVDVDNKTKVTVTTAPQIEKALRARYGVGGKAGWLKKSMISYDLRSASLSIRFQGARYSLVVNDGVLTSPAGHEVVPLKDELASTSPNGKFAVYTEGHDLYVKSNGITTRLTQDGSLWHSFSAVMATSNPTDENPTAKRPPLVRWVGEGPYFYITRWDNRNVGDTWQIDSLGEPRPKLITQKFAYAGEESIPVQELWVFNAETASGFQVANKDWAHVGNMDIPESGLYASRDGNSLYFARMTRGYASVQLCRVDLKNGQVDVVLAEPEGHTSSIRQVEFHELENGLIWKSDRDGYAHYYLFDKNGKLDRQLTSGSFSASRILSIDENAGRILYSAYGDAGKENPYYLYTQMALLDGSEGQRLDKEKAFHRTTVAPDGQYYVDSYARVDLPPVTVLKGANGSVLMKLHENDASGLQKIGWEAPERYSVNAADGETPLFGTIWFPTDFDSSQSYPVIAHVYPGPQGETAPLGRFYPHNQNRALAELGFIVVNTAHRGGASNRGRAYQSYPKAIGNMRDYALEDTRYVIRELAKQRPYMDTNRVGIYGHSGGGFMAVSAMLKYPGFFKVGVSGAGNHDNNIYEMNSGEFFFGNPVSERRQRYATNADYANRLQGRLLLIQGDRDRDVHTMHTMRLLRGFVEAGKKVDVVLLPGEGHWGFSAPSKAYYRLSKWDYFLEHLGGLKIHSVDLFK